MIVRKFANGFVLLFALRGSVIMQIWPRLLLVGALSVLALLWPWVFGHPIPAISAAPLSLIGLVLSIFLGFRNNVCYDRWWEARKQWGHMIAQTRALGREIPVLLPADPARVSRLLRRVIGFAACLCARLRDLDEAAAAAPWLPPVEAEALPGRRNRPGSILRDLEAELATAERDGEISAIMLSVLFSRVEELNGVQAACERIRTTPPPFSYSLLLHRTAWIFCLLLPFALAPIAGWAAPVMSLLLAYAFFGLDALGNELEEPFGLTANDLALDAMVRVIEIDLLEAAGEGDLPPVLQPVGYRLT